jgi:hypothetical protein
MKNKDKIYINPCEDGTIWVTSESDPIGIEYSFPEGEETPYEEKMLMSLAAFLGYDTDNLFLY